MNLALCGLGKAGREFVNYTLSSDEFVLRDVLCRKESKDCGKTVSEALGIITPRTIRVTNLHEWENLNEVDVLVDFSHSETSMLLFDLCCRKKINLVICTTDFSDEQINFIKEKTLREGIGVVYAPTLTPGINLVIDFVKKISAVFPEFNFEIIERHGRNKPVPTRTSRIIAANILRKDVPINSVRLDGYVGIHEVTATDGLERLSLIHESFTRGAFVRGALLACKYIHKRNGFHTMNEVVANILSNSDTL